MLFKPKIKCHNDTGNTEEVDDYECNDEVAMPGFDFRGL